MPSLSFTTLEVWNGGFYELALEVGSRSDDTLFATLRNVCQYPALTGPYTHRNREPTMQNPIALDRQHIATGLHLYGVATLSDGVQVACGTVTIREDSGVDWLTLYMPMGALDRVYPVGGFPFDGALLNE